MRYSRISTAVLTLAAASALGSSAAHAAAAPCFGVGCSAAASIAGADAPTLTSAATGTPSVAAPAVLEKVTVSGFYDYGTTTGIGQKAVGYASAPGQWASAPAAVKKLADGLITDQDRATSAIIVYGAGVVVTVPPATATRASTDGKGKARRAGDSNTCSAGAFCIWDGTNFDSSKGTFSDVGYWQNLSSYGWANRASSMRNRRGGWTLLERTTNARYCAKPNSEDSTLSNNGYNDNTGAVYLSSSTTKNSGWNCTN